MFLKTNILFFKFALFFTVYVIFFVSVFLPRSAFAQAYKCETPAEKKICSELLSNTEEEIAQLEKQLNKTKQEGASLARDKALLDLQIKQSQLKIKAHEITIANLGKDIVNKTKTISTLENRINDGRESLSQIIRKTREFDDVSFAELFLGTEDLSVAFADLDSFSSIQASMQNTFDELREAKQANEAEKASLDKKRNQEIDTRVNAEAQKKKIEQNEAEKRRLLALNATTQAVQQQYLADKAAKAAAIRSALFQLRDSGPIKFEDALAYANVVSKATGVRAAFILGILKQETNLGANVGQCYLVDPDTGAGKGKNTGTAFPKTMKPDRDVKPFLDITERLGLDPYSTVVSCPQSIGYGGAMGPSQFIPSTWIKYEDRVAKALGVKQANPWSAQHAFMATGLFLADLGAGNGGYSAEREAAARYYAGSNWAKNGLGYAASVLAFATKFQTDIDFLND